MSRPLLRSSRFAPLFWCQFFSALNDNVVKNALGFLILFDRPGSGAEGLVTLAGAVFMAPYFFLSALGGQLADRYDKALVARRLKLAEFAAAGLAIVGFGTRSVTILFVALFLYGVIGALFGPLKYGILPDHLSRQELPAGNALIEGATFMAILAGTVGGGLLMRGGGEALALAGAMMVMALLCWLSAVFIPPTGSAAPELAVEANVGRSTLRLLAELRHDRRQWRAAIVTSLFWMSGGIVLSLLAPLVIRLLHGSEMVVTIYLAIFAVAVAAGSGLASRLMDGRITFAPVVAGTIVIAGSCLFLGTLLQGAAPRADGVLLSPADFFRYGIAWWCIAGLSTLAIGGGLMIVPSFAAIQAWALADHRARAVAAVNVLNAAYMVVGTIVVAVLQAAGVGIPVVFLGLGLLAAAASIWIVRTMPAPDTAIVPAPLPSTR